MIMLIDFHFDSIFRLSIMTKLKDELFVYKFLLKMIKYFIIKCKYVSIIIFLLY